MLTYAVQAKANDADIVATSTVMSLKDPISYMRLRLPCRGSLCSHNQCFDASSFLQLQEQGPTWTCPICNKSITFDTLAVDQYDISRFVLDAVGLTLCRYVQEILQSTPSSVDQVTIEPNGAWSHAAADGQNGPGESDGDDDSDDLVEITAFHTSGLTYEPHTPTSLINQTMPAPSREATAGSSVSRGQKRQKVVVDLTLSDSDEPPLKRPSHRHINESSSLPDRPRNGYLLPNLSLHQSGSANHLSPFQVRRAFEAQLNQNTNSGQLGRSLQSPGPVSPDGSYTGGPNQQNQQEQDYTSYRYPQAYHQQDMPPNNFDYSGHSSMLRPPSYGGVQ
jgi:E3 SUMO-protein ligase PIAS1